LFSEKNKDLSSHQTTTIFWLS